MAQTYRTLPASPLRDLDGNLRQNIEQLPFRSATLERMATRAHRALSLGLGLGKADHVRVLIRHAHKGVETFKSWELIAIVLKYDQVCELARSINNAVLSWAEGVHPDSGMGLNRQTASEEDTIDQIIDDLSISRLCVQELEGDIHAILQELPGLPRDRREEIKARFQYVSGVLRRHLIGQTQLHQAQAASRSRGASPQLSSQPELQRVAQLLGQIDEVLAAVGSMVLGPESDPMAQLSHRVNNLQINRLRPTFSAPSLRPQSSSPSSSSSSASSQPHNTPLQGAFYFVPPGPPPEEFLPSQFRDWHWGNIWLSRELNGFALGENVFLISKFQATDDGLHQAISDRHISRSSLPLLHAEIGAIVTITSLLRVQSEGWAYASSGNSKGLVPLRSLSKEKRQPSPEVIVAPLHEGARGFSGFIRRGGIFNPCVGVVLARVGILRWQEQGWKMQLISAITSIDPFDMSEPINCRLSRSLAPMTPSYLVRWYSVLPADRAAGRGQRELTYEVAFESREDRDEFCLALSWVHQKVARPQ